MLYKKDEARITDLLYSNMRYCNVGETFQELLMHTSRQASALYPTWKRQEVYALTRKIYNDIIEPFIYEMYNYTIDNIQEWWVCTLWYDGPRAWRNLRNTKTLIWQDDKNMLSYMQVINISYDRYDELVTMAVASRDHLYQSVQDRFKEEGYSVRTICSRDFNNYFTVTDEFRESHLHWFI